MKPFILIRNFVSPLAMYRFAAVCAVMVFAFSIQNAHAAGSSVITLGIDQGVMVKLPGAASSIMVADPATADVEAVSPRMVFIRGKKIGVTSFYAVNSKDETIAKKLIKVTYDLDTLRSEVKQTVPTADISFRPFTGGLVVQGFANTIADAQKITEMSQAFIGDKDKLVNMIKTNGSDQVTLKVRIVEMARNDLKNLGINLQNLTNNGNFSLQLLQGNNLLYFPNNVNQTPDFLASPGNVLDRGTSTNSNLLLRYKSLSGVIDALETQGLANILAEPTLTTISGKQASFLAGGEFPLPVVQPGGFGNTVTIEYKPFGVSLKFTPVVLSKDRMSITVAPEVSTLNFDNPIQVAGITYPLLDTRKASAVVELGSGDSFMLAGLLENETSNNIKKFPGLGDLPVIGALFRSQQFQNNETELVILVTPYIVHPVAEAKLQTPLDGYVPPSDVQRMVYGNLYQQQPMQPAATTAAQPATDKTSPPLHNEGGFIVQ